jgi:hypothetical protein
MRAITPCKKQQGHYENQTKTNFHTLVFHE